MKFYHQQATKLNDSNQNIELILGEKNNYHQIGNAYLRKELTIEKDVAVATNRDLVDANAIRVVSNAFEFCLKETRLSETGSPDIEHIKYVGQLLTIMRALTNNDGELLSHCDKNVESEAETEKTSLHHHLINNHDVAANKGKIKTQSPLKQIFGFYRTFKKITKYLGTHLTLKTSDLQDVIHFGR